MAWMRAVAGANLITSFRVIYQLVGLTTTGASSATAYAPFTFALAGSGNRVPPATINVYSDGLLLTVGVDYSYNSATGSVTIYRVAGDIVVEATGKIATIIYTPSATCTWFAIVKMPSTSQSGYNNKYAICWFDAKPTDGWHPASGYATWNLLTRSGTAGAAMTAKYHSQGFDTADAALNALYIKTAAQYTSGNIKAVTERTISQFSGASFAVYAPGEVPYANFAATWYILISVNAYYSSQTALYTNEYGSLYTIRSVVTDYDVIEVIT